MSEQKSHGVAGANPAFTRNLFIVIILGALGICALLGLFYFQATAYMTKKSEARDVIISLGGTVKSIGLSDEASPGSNWLIREFGVGEKQEELWHVEFPKGKLSSAVSSQDLQKISEYDWIRSLDLSNTQIDDGAAEHLVKLTKLRILSLTDTAVTDAGIEKLAPLKRLLKLDTQGTSVTYAGLAKLDKAISGTNFEEQLALAQLPMDQVLVDTAIRSFGEKQNDEKNMLFAPPDETKQIQILTKENLSNEEIELIRHLTNVRQFTSVRANFPPQGLEFLTDLPLLQAVSILGGNLQDSDLKYIAGLSKLKRATIRGNFTDGGFAVFQKAEALESLELSGADITTEVLAQFQGMKSLRDLDLAFFANLQENAEHLPATDEQIEKAKRDLTVLSRIPQLSKLKIYGNLIVKGALEPLGDIKTLKDLELDERSVSKDSIVSLREALPDCQIILTQPKVDD